MQIKSNARKQVLQKMQSNDLLKSNENNEDNAKVTAYINATIIIPSTETKVKLHLKCQVFLG
jgi:hypothetical protein